MKKFLQKKNVLSRTIVTLLTMAMLFGSITTTALAAEPIVPDVTVSEIAVPEVAVSEIAVPEVAVSEVASQANNENEGIMPLGVGGYAAKYTDPLRGSFTVNAPGDGNGSGTLQITTHEFSNNPIINVVLYRPNGTCAGEIYINGNGTKQLRITNVVPGTYKIVYAVEGVHGGWISAWVSS